MTYVSFHLQVECLELKTASLLTRKQIRRHGPSLSVSGSKPCISPPPVITQQELANKRRSVFGNSVPTLVRAISRKDSRPGTASSSAARNAQVLYYF